MQTIRTLDYGTFSIEETAIGFQSYNKEGKPLIFSAIEDHCAFWSHKLLAAQQDGGWS